MITKHTNLFIALLLGILTPATGYASSRGFAIFVDSLSHSKVSSELEMYAGSINRQGLDAEIVVTSMDITPDSLRSIISDMSTRKKSPIEGMVFVGDIPIPMLLDAQHFTSAFKTLQSSRNLERSAVPSDRFYDDPELRFDFVSRDAKKPGLYYYSLRADAPATVAPKLYSGRIKSMDFYGKDKYENLRDYLKKVVRIKQRNEKLERMFLFSGSGYNSESTISRIDEKTGLLEQFPWMRRQASSLSYLDHKHTTFAKYTLMSQIQRPDLSIALLHHHGSPVKEYINRYPDTRSTRDQLEGAKFFFRTKIRSAVENGTPLDTACANYARDYDVPLCWFDSIMDPASIAADSIYNDQLDLHMHDFERYTPNARVVMLDACYNGSFNNDIYVAGAYIFGDGDCVVTIANSVNSLQDKWCDKYIGLLGLGMRVGNMVKYNPYLESHIIGDPTFAFAPITDLKYDINQSLTSASPSFWKEQLASSPYPAMQAAAIEMLANSGHLSPAQISEQFHTSNNGIVRFSALMQLSKTGDKEFLDAIEYGLDDSYELVRRFSAIFAGKNGNPELIPYVVKAYANELKGERVNFQLQNALPLFDHELLMQELAAQRPYRHAYDEEAMMQKARKALSDRFSSSKYDEVLGMLASDEPDMREVKSFVRQLRNNPLHPAVTQLLAYVDTCNDDAIRVSLIEALGWFNYSYRADEVADRMKKVAADTRFSEAARKEAAKTVVRLSH